MLLFNFICSVVGFFLASSSLTFGLRTFSNRLVSTQSSSRLYKVPLELINDLDPSRTWEVKFILDGVEKVAVVREDTSLLESGEQLFDDVPSSCRNGVCTTCAGKIDEGRDKVKLAVHGLGKPQIEAGYVCTCQAYPTGPGIVVRLNMYDEVYESQYGQFERSYGELKYTKKEEPKEEKKKGLFGW